MSIGIHSEAGESTSRTLLERVRVRDPEAWQRFAALYGPFVYRWSVRYGLQPHDAADVTQEVFRTVAENLDRFQRRAPGDSLRGWLWTVTRNKIHDYHRRRRQEPSAAGGTAAHYQMQQVPDLPESTDDAPGSISAELAHRALRLMQSDFEPTTWQAFWKVVVDGRSTAEAAQELALSVAAVYKAKSRVLIRLRQELDGLLD
jgi:RNA polymerase sigma-70 factor (ECF subfamily)